MKILVTGGAGFIGSFIVDELIRKEHEVIVYDNLSPQVHPSGQLPSYLNKNVRIIYGDIRDYGLLKRAISEVDVIFHEAAAVGVGQSQYKIKEYVDINIGGTANLLDIMANEKHHIKKLIIPGSMSTYGEGSYECKNCGKVRIKVRLQDSICAGIWEPKCPNCEFTIKATATDELAQQNCAHIYAITKKAQEEMAMTIGKIYNIPTVILRFFNVYGPRQSLNNPYNGVAAIFMSRIKNNNKPIIYEDGLQTRDFISVHDVIDANILAMENTAADYQIFNVGTGIPITILSVAEVLAELYNKKIQPEITGKFRKGDIRHCYADINKIKSKLGFMPRVSFVDGMKELIEWAHNTEAIDKFSQAADELRAKGLI